MLPIEIIELIFSYLPYSINIPLSKKLPGNIHQNLIDEYHFYNAGGYLYRLIQNEELGLGVGKNYDLYILDAIDYPTKDKYILPIILEVYCVGGNFICALKRSKLLLKSYIRKYLHETFLEENHYAIPTTTKILELKFSTLRDAHKFLIKFLSNYLPDYKEYKRDSYENREKIEKFLS